MSFKKALSFSGVSAAVLIWGTISMAQTPVDSSGKLEVLVSATCACYHPGSRVPYLGEVIGDAVYVTTREELSGKSESQLMESMTGEVWRAINESARSSCGRKARWAQNGTGGSMSVAFGMEPRASCSSDLHFSKPRL